MQQGMQAAAIPMDYLSISKTYAAPWFFTINGSDVFRVAAQTDILVYQCPSETPKEAANIFVGIHTAIKGPGQATEDYGALSNPISIGGKSYDFAPTNYVAVAGYLGTLQPGLLGMFADRSAVRLELVTNGDGTSNTLMFGEAIGDNTGGTRNYAHSWMGSGAMITAFGLADPSQASVNGYAVFSSRHPGVVQFCFGDGSVRGLRKFLPPGTNDFNVYVYISSWTDGYTDIESIVQ
jgi:prepilin-type processing-associated H-X9-DG protein